MKTIKKMLCATLLLALLITTISPAFAALGPNIITNPGFELSSTVTSPWRLSGTGGIDRNLGFQHSGRNNAWVRSTSGWNKIYQVVNVQPRTNYTLKGWIQSAVDNTDGYFGVRLPNNGAIINETIFGHYGNYKEVTIEFYTGSLTSVEVFCGIWGNSKNPWARLDDVSLSVNDKPHALKKRIFMVPGTFEIRPGQSPNTPTGLLKILSDKLNKNIFDVVFVNYPACFGPIPGTGNVLEALGNPSYVESRDRGVDEVIRLINMFDGEYGVIGYSQGGAIASLVGREHSPGGRLAHRANDCVWIHAFASPHRGKGRAFHNGNYAELQYEGVSNDNMVNTPPGIDWFDYCFRDDFIGNTDLKGTFANQLYPLITEMSFADPVQAANRALSTLNSPEWRASISEFVTNPLVAHAKLQKTITTIERFITTGAHGQYNNWIVKDGMTPIQHSANHLNYWGARR